MVGRGDSAAAAQDNLEDVLSSLAALGVQPALTDRPVTRSVELDPRQLLDPVDLI